MKKSANVVKKYLDESGVFNGMTWDVVDVCRSKTDDKFNCTLEFRLMGYRPIHVGFIVDGIVMMQADITGDVASLREHFKDEATRISKQVSEVHEQRNSFVLRPWASNVSIGERLTESRPDVRTAVAVMRFRSNTSLDDLELMRAAAIESLNANVGWTWSSTCATPTPVSVATTHHLRYCAAVDAPYKLESDFVEGTHLAPDNAGPIFEQRFKCYYVIEEKK